VRNTYAFMQSSHDMQHLVQGKKSKEQALIVRKCRCIRCCTPTCNFLSAFYCAISCVSP